MSGKLERGLSWLFYSMDSTLLGFGEDSLEAASLKAQAAGKKLQVARNMTTLDISDVHASIRSDVQDVVVDDEEEDSSVTELRHTPEYPPPDCWKVIIKNS